MPRRTSTSPTPPSRSPRTRSTRRVRRAGSPAPTTASPPFATTRSSRLLKNPKLRQGSVAWPAHNGVTEGPFADWWASWILNKEGEEHHRLRRLLNPAFSPKLIAGADAAVPGTRGRAHRRLRRQRPLRVHRRLRRPVRRPRARDHARHPRGGVAGDRHRGGHHRPGHGSDHAAGAAPDRGGAPAALRLRRRAHRRPACQRARRLRDQARPGASGQGRPVRHRAQGRAGAAHLRRLRHHPQPARAGDADLPAASGPVGAARPSVPSWARRRWRRSCASTRPRAG